MTLDDPEAASSLEPRTDSPTPSLAGPHFLTEGLLLRWMLLFRQRERKWPGSQDDIVWERDRNGEWVTVRDERWKAITASLLAGSRGLGRLKGRSLSQLRQMHGLTPVLDKKTVIQWFNMYLEREGRWPNHMDETVWQKDRRGQWMQVNDKTWLGISTCIACGLNGIDRMSLIRFRRNYVENTHQAAPELDPTIDEKPLSKDPIATGALGAIQPDPSYVPEAVPTPESIGQITPTQSETPLSLSSNRHGTVTASIQGPKRRASNRPLSKSQLTWWINKFYEKEGKWPTTHDSIVWDTAGEDQWVEVSGETWCGISNALYSGHRNLDEFKGTTLLQFRRQAGLHRDLCEDVVVRWMRLFREKEGRWPSQHDRVVWDRDAENQWKLVNRETWTAINIALRVGGRGLQTLKGTSLPRLRAKHNLIDEAFSLTKEKIEDWIKKYHAKEGAWPTRHDLTVWDRDEKDQWKPVDQITWGVINDALYFGWRGLQDCKGSTLTKLQQECGLHDTPKEPLTQPMLLRWITLFNEREGKWPTGADLAVWDRNERTGEWINITDYTWQTIDRALSRGTHGLHALRGSSLSEFKQQHGLRVPDLTEAQILNWIELFHQKEGRWPTATDEVVWELDSKKAWQQVQGARWATLSMALRSGSRGLPGGSSLWSLRLAHGFYEDNTLTPEKIVHRARLFHERLDRWPTANDKSVWDTDGEGQVVRLKRETWKAIDSALYLGLRGLTAFKGMRLAGLLRQHGLEESRLLTTQTLIHWITQFHAKEGKWPSIEDKIVWDRTEGGEWIVVKGEGWEALNATLRKGSRGLHELRGQTISAFRHTHGLHDNRTVEQVIRWIKLFHEKESRWPTQHDTTVWDRNDTQPWFIVPQETWGRLDQAIRQGCRGLLACKGSSLPKLRRQHGLHDDLNAGEIERWIKLFHEKEGRWPNNSDRTIWDRDATNRWFTIDRDNWRIIDTALHLGLRGLKPFTGSSLAQFRSKKGLIDNTSSTNPKRTHLSSEPTVAFSRAPRQ